MRRSVEVYIGEKGKANDAVSGAVKTLQGLAKFSSNFGGFCFLVSFSLSGSERLTSSFSFFFFFTKPFLAHNVDLTVQNSKNSRSVAERNVR